jgi:hypothetical protein
MPVPVISATVTGSPLNVVNAATLPPPEVNTIGRVVVVPAGITYARLITSKPLKGRPTLRWLLKSKRTSFVPTVTDRERNAGMPD